MTQQQPSKLQLQEEAMKKYEATQKSKAALASKTVPSSRSPVTALASPATPTPIPNPPVAASTLSAAAVKSLSSNGASPQVVSNIDVALGKFVAGSLGPEGLYAAVKGGCGTDGAFEAFPYLIGRVKLKEKKSALNSWFQSQAN